MEIKIERKGVRCEICIRLLDQSHFSLQIKLTFPEAIVAGQIQRDSF